MARKLRFEYPGALYHIINRGNYRSWIFESEGAKESFEKTLFECCERANWILHSYVIMDNHFHLALETPNGNLVDGMRWLQSVFAMRFNRFRHENGALFQGRYKSLPVEGGDRLAWLCHYINLNPVRAGLCDISNLKTYRYGSYWFLRKRKQRPDFLDLSTCLEGAEISVDGSRGWSRYDRYLSWLVEDEPTRKAMEFERMSKGWALGDKSFKKGLIQDERQMKAAIDLGDVDAVEARELAWNEIVLKCVRVLKLSEEDILSEVKSSDAKVAIAGYLKKNYLCRNKWLGERLAMGSESGVSRYVSQMDNGERPHAQKIYKTLIAKIKH